MKHAKKNKSREKVKERFQASAENLIEIRIVEMDNVTIAEINSIEVKDGKETTKNVRIDEYKAGTDINKILEETRSSLRAQSSIKSVTNNMDIEVDIFNSPQKKK